MPNDINSISTFMRRLMRVRTQHGNLKLTMCGSTPVVPSKTVALEKVVDTIAGRAVIDMVESDKTYN